MQIHDWQSTFISATLPSISGWLGDPAALFTFALLEHLEVTGCAGPSLEIGVWKGKYLSVLYEHARRTEGSKAVFGVDIFSLVPPREVEENIRAACSEAANLMLRKKSSAEMAPQELLEWAGAPFRFISVDGDHEPDGVYHDMVLANAILAQGGIVAIDDFLNPMAIGVVDGALRYFHTTPSADMAPVAFCSNKLFLCRRQNVEAYKAAIERFIDANQQVPMFADFVKRREQGRHWVDFKFLSGRVFVL